MPYPYPFYLDARQNTGYNQFQYFDEPWSEARSLRRRAYVNRITVPAGETYTKNDSIIWMEKLLLQEAALELGFEGHRWGDLMRIAHRKNNRCDIEPGSGTELLNEAIRQKFLTEKREAPPDLNPNNWFLKRK